MDNEKILSEITQLAVKLSFKVDSYESFIKSDDFDGIPNMDKIQAEKLFTIVTKLQTDAYKLAVAIMENHNIWKDEGVSHD